MRVFIILTLFLAMPAIGFSQGIQQLVDGENQFVPQNWQPEKTSVSSITSSVGRAVDVVGGTDFKSSNKTGLAKGNSYRVDIDVTLSEMEFWLEFSTTQTLRYYVFESPVEMGTYNKIFETSSSVTGTGAGWYSSGSISVPLPKDNYYIIAVSWDGTLSYFYNTGDLQATSFGSYVHGYATGLDPLGATIVSTTNDQAIYHQRLTTGTGPPDPLSVNPSEISAWFGGTATFKLNGGPDLGGRGYGLFGTTSGTSPGFPLPGGGVLPINWDWFTYIVYFLSLAPGNGIVDGMLGTLDVDGMAEATLTLPGHCQLFDDILTNWAWTTSYPFDFQSNPVDLLITGAPLPPPDYVYDDGSSENALGWTAGGESVWAHYFDAGIGDTITAIQSTFGQAGSTSGPPNGDPCWLYVWNDPTNDNNPIDAVLVGTGTGVIANSATNDFNNYVLDAPTAVDGGFFVGCHVWQDVGIFAAPMDQNTPYGGEAWFMGGSVFDPNDLTTTYIYEMGSIGFPAYWLLRATTD